MDFTFPVPTSVGPCKGLVKSLPYWENISCITSDIYKLSSISVPMVTGIKSGHFFNSLFFLSTHLKKKKKPATQGYVIINSETLLY